MKKMFKIAIILLFWTMTNLVYSANPYNLSSESYTTTKLWSAAYTASMNLKPWNTQITSFNGNTYIVYVDPNLRPKVVKVDSNGSQEAFLDQSDYAALGDAHHQFSIGVDEKGYIHITGDMHNYPAANTYHMPTRYQSGNIMYWRSDNPEDISSFTWMGGTVGKCPYGYGNSYCSFFNDHEGHLFHVGRCWATFSYMGGKKDCASMSRYDAETGNWEEIGGLPGVNKITMNTLFWEDNAEGGTSSYARVRPWGVADMDNRLHMVCNLLNNNDYPVGGHINTDCVYIRSTDGADSFTKTDGSAVPLPARVEAGTHQGDVLLSFNYLGSDNAVAVDQNLNPHVLVKSKDGQSTILSYDPTEGWTDHGWANCTTVAGSERIYNDAMGVMTISKYGYLYRFWNWDEATNQRANVGRVYNDIDRCHLQNTGNIQGLSKDGGQLALFRTTITRPQPEIEVEGLGVAISNRDDTPSIADHTDWGNVDLGSVYTNTYTLRNVGNTPLRLYTVRTTHPDFSVIEQPQGTLAVNTQTSFKIEYRPSAHGEINCRVSFGNSDLNDSRFMFALAADCTGGSLPPTALPDTYSIAMDTLLQVAAPGVLDNDVNPNSLPITAIKTSDPQHGSVTLNADGSFIYSPNNGYIGPDTFTYKAHSGTHDSIIATVNLTVAPRGLEAHWKLDEPVGATTALDASANGFHASNSSVTAGEPGKIDQAYRLDASSDITTPALNLNTNTLTITGWVNSDAVQNDWSAVYFCRGGTTTTGLNVKNNRELRYHWKDGQYGWSSGLIVPGNQWAFVALVIEPTRAIMYMHDGSEMQSRTNITSHAVEAFDAVGHIGNDPTSSSRRFLGLIDDVRVYSQSLSAADISDLYEEAQPDADRDGDGLTDAQEIALGTDPDDPESDFSVMANTPLPMSGKFQITWPSSTGVLYKVWNSPDLSDWTVARDWTNALTPPEDSLEINLSPSNGFFKVEADIQ